MILIPPDRLSAEVLEALIEEFVTRHGTNLADASAKALQVRAQLKTGQVVIVYDEKSDSTNIVAKDAKEEPLPPPPPAANSRASKPAAVEDGEQRIVYDEPAPPDPTEF
jgi:uncharacterized protein YheU (UPF0270 family)